MNIEYGDIQSFKQYDLPEIIRSYGREVKKTREGYLTNCPFHDDKTPSLSINKKGDIWLWHCFGCRKGGTVIDFVMGIENLTLRETYRKLADMGGSPQKPATPKRPAEGINKLDLLRKVTDYYHKTFYEDTKGLDYLKERGITSSETYNTFKIGYANGMLKRMLPLTGPVLKALKEIGILNDKGNEFFYNCVVIPLYDEDGNIVSLYGRNVLRKGHLYLKGPHRGLVNRQGAYNTDKLVLTESIIDALSLYEIGARNVIPCYGTGGFTEDHKILLRERRPKEIEIAFDNDEAGIKGGEFLATALEAENISTVRIVLPAEIKDVNDYLLAGGTKEALASLEREPLHELEYTIQKGEDSILIKRANISYRVRIGHVQYLRSMKVNIRLVIGEEYTVDVVDLYSSRSRKSYAKRIAKRFAVETEEIEKDLFRILEEIESSSNEEAGKDEPAAREMTDEEKEEALRALKDTDLTKIIISDLEKTGCVGEDMNKLLGYIVTVSRKLDMPLSLIIVSQSGAGKSNLADTLENIIPQDECVHLSRITPQALYYMDKTALKRKVLIIEEKEGSSQADYSIRVLQSKKHLRLAVPIKDPKTGRMKTSVFEVEGPVSVVETTTKTDINPENASRCFIVYLDESEDQTRRIHHYQRAIKTIQGAQDKRETESIIRKHQNMQRLLEPVVVSNPYVDHIEFPTRWIRVRRDYMKFLNLIEAVTFLHQYQRERKLSGDGIEYIESTIDDYKTAYQIARDVIGDCLTELMKPERDFFERIKDMSKKRGQKLTRRHIRAFTGLPDHVVRRLLNTLVEMEYLLVVEGKKGQRYEYAVHPEFTVKEEIISGLTTPEELEKKISADELLSAALKP